MGNSFGCSASGERLVSERQRFSWSGIDALQTLLLENGADVNSTNYCGQAALMQACRYGHWEVVQTLILFRCNVTRADYLSWRTALHFAAFNGFDRLVSFVYYLYLCRSHLLGAGSTPLHYAACGGNLKCCQILLARGSSRLALNCNGWLPLDVARMWGRHWLEPLLNPNSDLPLPIFPRSNYLSLPVATHECAQYSKRLRVATIS